MRKNPLLLARILLLRIKDTLMISDLYLCKTNKENALMMRLRLKFFFHLFLASTNGSPQKKSPSGSPNRVPIQTAWRSVRKQFCLNEWTSSMKSIHTVDNLKKWKKETEGCARDVRRALECWYCDSGHLLLKILRTLFEWIDNQITPNTFAATYSTHDSEWLIDISWVSSSYCASFRTYKCRRSVSKHTIPLSSKGPAM